jgi:hypothetical protein
VVDLSDPESLESKVSEREPEELPKWRLEQEQERAKREAEVEAKVAASKSVGDVLEVFESQQVKALSMESPMTERARGVADDSEELLSQDLLESDAPAPSPRASTGPSGAKKSSAPSATPAAPPSDAAKQAALKAARMAALQPIAPAAPKAVSPVTRPPASTPATRPPATVAAASTEAPKPAEKVDIARTQPLETLPEGTQAGLAALKIPEIAEVSSAIASRKVDLGSTQPLGTLAQDLADMALMGAELADVSKPAAAKPEVSKPVESKQVEKKKAEPKADDSTIATGSLNEFGELTLLATGEWQAMQRSDTKTETKSEPKAAKPAELSGPEALSLISKPAPDELSLLPEPQVEPKRAANGE